MLASIARWGLIFGTGGRDDRGQNPLGLLVMAIVAPLAAMIVQLAISRQNEFQADATAARLTGDPRGLASALQRIEGYAAKIPMAVNPAAAVCRDAEEILDEAARAAHLAEGAAREWAGPVAVAVRHRQHLQAAAAPAEAFQGRSRRVSAG